MLVGTLVGVNFDNRLLIKLPSTHPFLHTIMEFFTYNKLFRDKCRMPFIEFDDMAYLMVSLPADKRKTKLNEIEKLVGKEVWFQCNFHIGELETDKDYLQSIECVLFGDMHEI